MDRGTLNGGEHALQPIRTAILQMIRATDDELDEFVRRCTLQTFRKHERLSAPERVPQQIFFINRGLVRVLVVDAEGVEHTVHFALENQFIADYSNFILQQPSFYAIEALEPTETVVLPRAAIEWGYEYLEEGQKLGRLVAEYYFIYHDQRIRNLYLRTPRQRYESITELFPNLHNRVPQRMIASFLGVTPIHLSRLKKAGRLKT